MPDYRYFLYDTASFGATPNAEIILFQTPQGGDSTHTESFTNMRGAGQLPQTEKFEIDWCGVVLDQNLVKADIINIWLTGIFEIRIADFTVLKVPLQLVVAASSWAGSQVQTAAADSTAVGLIGNGYSLDKHINLPGATPFKVRILTGLGVTAAQKVKAVLSGIYTIAGAS